MIWRLHLTPTNADEAGGMGSRLAVIVVSVVTAVWAIFCGAAIVAVFASHNTLDSGIFLQVNATFASVVGSSLAFALKQGKDGGEGKS